MNDDGVRPHDASGTNRYGSQDFRTRADGDPVLQCRMPFDGFQAAAPQGNPVVHHAVVPDFRRLPDDHTHAVVDEETPADLRCWVYLDSGEESRELRHTPSKSAQPANLPQPIGEAVPPDCVQSRIGEENEHSTARSRVVAARSAYVLTNVHHAAMRTPLRRISRSDPRTAESRCIALRSPG